MKRRLFLGCIVVTTIGLFALALGSQESWGGIFRPATTCAPPTTCASHDLCPCNHQCSEDHVLAKGRRLL